MVSIIILWDHRRICGPSLTETSLCGAYLYAQWSRIAVWCKWGCAYTFIIDEIDTLLVVQFNVLSC